MVYQAFQRVAARRNVGGASGGTVQHKGLAAPVRGWVTNENIAAQRPGSARVMDDMFPERETVRLRRGSDRYATLDEEHAVTSLFNYVGGNASALFAASDGNVYDLTTVADAEVTPTPVLTGMTGNYWVAVNYATSGGNFMVAVNGADAMQLYDGTDFMPVTETTLYEFTYDAETGNFTEGETLTGGSSAATATIVKVIDEGTTGTLWINNVSGTFEDDETITDGGSGSADALGTPVAIATAITGISTAALSHVSVYRNRLYFVEEGSMSVHYLGAGAISGTASELSLAGVFQNGGSILLTGTWSLDAGDGLDDKFVVVSTEGEVAIYQGSNPGDANSWSLVGRYEITRPLGSKATMRAGGDLMVATEQGLIPISACVTKDVAALSQSAVSANIEPDWHGMAIERRTSPWEVIKWPEKNMGLISLPANPAGGNPSYVFVVNLQTGAWARFRNWDALSMCLHNGQVYFGTHTGTVLAAELSGSDEGTPYYPTVVYNWDHMGSFGSMKVARQARATMIAGTPVIPQISLSANYEISLPASPPSSGTSEGSSLWDSGLWDVAQWDEGTTLTLKSTRWVSVAKTGYVFAPQVQFTQSGSVPPSAELVEVTITWAAGSLVN